MSRKFSFTVPYAVPVEDLHRALVRDDVWHARFEEALTATLELSHPEGANTIRIHMVERADKDKVPGIVRKLLKADLILSRTDDWHAIDGATAKGVFHATTSGIAGDMSGAYELRPTAEGCEIAVVGTVQVKVPLVGGAIEPLAEQLYRKVLSSERVFFEKWVAAQADA
ncbi:DUF2505 domain-containing protein [Nocardia bovistercoris]|uniref:DUF2505 domain-containing protein n=1 Tax=Nocardia bovistercoris TaxID=2785916 RepID=A0A931IBI9_9NOCA|nr:DUF2505 domain-containing protein [Nocardia bovistercoris]MBH0778379.1 DUF2505 domain-containing protein [Nocardia bovistercoris]